MENEQMNQQPTYEQVVNAYNALVNENHQLRNQLEVFQSDRLLERLKTVMQIMEHKDCYSETIIKLAEWHLSQMLAKPKKK